MIDTVDASLSQSPELQPMPAEEAAIVGFVGTISTRSENRLKALNEKKSNTTVVPEIRTKSEALFVRLNSVRIFLDPGTNLETITTNVKGFARSGDLGNGVDDITYRVLGRNPDNSQIQVEDPNGNHGSIAVKDLVAEATRDLEANITPEAMQGLDLTQQELDLVIQAAKIKTGEQADQIDISTLVEAAKNMGFVTADHGRSFINKNFEAELQAKAGYDAAKQAYDNEVPDADGNKTLQEPEELSPEIQTKLAERDRLLALLDGKTILTGKDVVELMKESEINPEIVGELLEKAKENIRLLETKGLIDTKGNVLVKAGSPNGKDLAGNVVVYTQAEIFELQARVNTYKAEITAYEAISKQQDLAQIIDQHNLDVENGIIPRADATAAAEAFANNDIDKMAEILLKNKITSEGERIAHSQEIKQAMDKAKRIAGIGGGLIAMMILLVLLQSMKGGGGQR
jgi:hypothetical protein